MPLFEQAPWTLVPVVIVIVEGWNAAKYLFAAARETRRSKTA